ncbi:acyl carrier protein [Sphingosinicella sp. BN140058]|uniref:acyl carrier protein n=1 Tax=Sphingosinicella sp. BN140058 TaxID=1892855 RepID=UPI0013E9FB71|nr:acyl carrier protein [Sphingosinicella sp. BN140058]
MSDTPTRDQLIAFILDRLSRRLSGAATIDLDRDLIELGLKSVDAVLISGEIEDAFDLEIEPVLLFEARTVNRVADSVLRSAQA